MTDTIKNTQSVSDLMEAAKDKRAIYTFTLPEKTARQAGVKSIGLVQLTGEEELAAAKLGGQDHHKVGRELVKTAFRYIDGKRMSDELTESVWYSSQYSIVRTLAATAYRQVAAPPEDESAGFLQSLQITVG